MKQRHQHRTSIHRILLLAAWILLSLILADVQRTKSNPSQANLIERAKHAYLGGHYLTAKKMFEEAKAAEPRSAVALYGYARAAHALHLYHEAIPAYEKALESSPKDEQMWADYISALAWGGIFKSNSKMLTQARDKGLTALAMWPDNASLYHSVEEAAGKLNEVELYMRSLEGLQERFPTSPVLAIELQTLKLRLASAKKNQQGMDRLKDALRADLKALASDSVTLSNLPPAQLYRMAQAYRLLGEEAKYASAFEALRKTPEGRRLAASIILPYWPGMMSLFTNADPKTVNLAERLQKIRFYLESIHPAWESGQSQIEGLLGREFDTLAEAARQRFSPKAKPTDVAAANLPEVKLESLIALGERMTEMATTQGANWFIKTAQLLLDLNLKPEEVIRLSTKGIKALEARQPGMVYPGDTEPEMEQAYVQSIARLKITRGEALEKTGQIASAEKLLREAVKDSPSGRAYATLGRFLLARGKKEEAYAQLISALAQGLPKGSALEEQTRAAVAQAVEALKKSETALAEDIARRKESFAAEEERKLVTNRLNQPAPAFALKDTTGKTWRLSDLAGKVVVLNYWATWCGPCVAEFPHYQKLVQEYATSQDVIFLAISTDDDPEIVKPWLKEKGYDFTVLHDQGSSIDYKVTGIPVTFMIAPDGKIAYRTVGFNGEAKYLKEMRTRIEALRAK